jgi:hypothetical protein
MAWAARAFFIHGVVLTGAGRAPTPCLLGEGKPKPLSLLDAISNSFMESSIMAHHRDGDQLWVETMKAAPKLLLLWERLRSLK